MARQRKKGRKWIKQGERLAIYARDNFTCVYCQETTENLSLDHIICYSHGGSDKHNNLVTCCQKCNSIRGNKKIEDFATHASYNRIVYALASDMKRFRKIAHDAIKKHGSYSKAKTRFINHLTS